MGTEAFQHTAPLRYGNSYGDLTGDYVVGVESGDMFAVVRTFARVNGPPRVVNYRVARTDDHLMEEVFDMIIRDEALKPD